MKSTIVILIAAVISDLVVRVSTSRNSTNYFNENCSDIPHGSLTPSIHLILCAVDSKAWSIAKNSSTLLNAGCLLGANRCDSIMHVPTEVEVRPSPPPPDALNKDYQRLAAIAETMVPKIWWRDGFDNDKLLLSHNDTELPRKLFNIRQLSNKKLRNLYQCVSRQQFIRVSLHFDSATSPRKSKCEAMKEPVIMKFFELWTHNKDSLGRQHVELIMSSLCLDFEVGMLIIGGNTSHSADGTSIWFPNMVEGGLGSQLLVASMEALHHFYENPYSSIWTGCFRLEQEPDCRGAIAGKK